MLDKFHTVTQLVPAFLKERKGERLGLEAVSEEMGALAEGSAEQIKESFCLGENYKFPSNLAVKGLHLGAVLRSPRLGRSL